MCILSGIHLLDDTLVWNEICSWSSRTASVNDYSKRSMLRTLGQNATTPDDIQIHKTAQQLSIISRLDRT